MARKRKKKTQGAKPETAAVAPTGTTPSSSKRSRGTAAHREARARHTSRRAPVPAKGLGRFGKFALRAAPGLAAYAMLSESRAGRQREQDVTSLLAQLEAGRTLPGAEAAQTMQGFDALMAMEREAGRQAPPGTRPASPFLDRIHEQSMTALAKETPIVDRLEAFMPDLLESIRSRVRPSLWPELTDSEIKVTAEPTEQQLRAERDILEQTLEEELGLGLPGGQAAASMLAF